jgi:hypothetical protein
MGANGANYANFFLGNLLYARAKQPALPGVTKLCCLARLPPIVQTADPAVSNHVQPPTGNIFKGLLKTYAHPQLSPAKAAPNKKTPPLPVGGPPKPTHHHPFPPKKTLASLA